jgi:hypothetical protein
MVFWVVTPCSVVEEYKRFRLQTYPVVLTTKTLHFVGEWGGFTGFWLAGTKIPLGRPRRRWKDNIKMDLKEIGINGTNWVLLS